MSPDLPVIFLSALSALHPPLPPSQRRFDYQLGELSDQLLVRLRHLHRARLHG